MKHIFIPKQEDKTVTKKKKYHKQKKTRLKKFFFLPCYKFFFCTDEIVMLDKVIAVYKQLGDVYFYIVGGHDENELILENTMETINETLNHLLRSQIDKRTILENYDYLLLAIDEIIDNGVIMETDHELVIKRVSLKNFDNDLPIGEQTITQALKTAKEKILENLAN